MKIQIIIAATVIGLMTGCASDNINEPSGLGATIGTLYSELPTAVQQTIRTQRPNAQIVDIDKEERSGRTVYEVQFAEPGINSKLHIAADGTVVQ